MRTDRRRSPKIPTRIQKGSTIDGFLVGDLLHQGGMATLRKVTRPDIDFPILMKVPRLLGRTDPGAIVGFEMERMILPRLNGVHVPKFVGAGDLAAQPYIVMEQIPGPSLLRLRERLPLSPERVAEIGAKVATALHDLHGQHVVHLDVKPSNVLMRPTGEAVLVDFGLARHDHLPDLMEEQFRIPYGTGTYMAPEQILGIRRDPRSDLFALGVLLYFFSTGIRPFGDTKGKRRLQKRLWRDPVPPRKLRPGFPPWLQEIILRCLEVDPSRRHPTAARLAFDLTNPDHVNLTGRSDRTKQDPWSAVIRRRFQPPDSRPALIHAVAARIPTAPILAVALDVVEGSEDLAEAIRVTVRRILEIVPGARLACLNVLKQNRLAPDQKLDEEGRNKHVQRLVELKRWAQPLGIAEERITFHVLEAVDTPGAILEYARTNHIDHVVLGARTNSTLRNILGSVSGEVAARAPCSVTVVRPPRLDSDEASGETP